MSDAERVLPDVPHTAEPAGGGPSLRFLWNVTTDELESRNARSGPWATMEACLAGLSTVDPDPIRDRIERAAAEGSPLALIVDLPWPPRGIRHTTVITVDSDRSAKQATTDRIVAVDPTKADALLRRAVTDQAKGVIAALYGHTEEQAFDELRHLSQRQNRKLVDVAADLVRDAKTRAATDAPSLGLVHRLIDIMPVPALLFMRCVRPMGTCLTW